jgi:hypothetical protein
MTHLMRVWFLLGILPVRGKQHGSALLILYSQENTEAMRVKMDELPDRQAKENSHKLAKYSSADTVLLITRGGK